MELNIVAYLFVKVALFCFAMHGCKLSRQRLYIPYKPSCCCSCGNFLKRSSHRVNFSQFSFGNLSYPCSAIWLRFYESQGLQFA